MIDYSPFPAYTLPITTLFVDIGGVLLTNGCGLASHQPATTTFALDWAEIEQQHPAFSTCELGQLSLADLLRRVVFYRPHLF